MKNYKQGFKDGYKKAKEELNKSNIPMGNVVYIPELNIKIEKEAHDGGLSYNQLVEKYGKEYLLEHLPTYTELQWLRNNEKYCKDLGLINTWEFAKQEDKLSEKNNYVAVFYTNSDRAYFNCNGNPSNSDSALLVRFVFRGKNVLRK